MTRAGEKLYPDEAGPRGSVFWALVTLPMFRRGAWEVARVSACALLLAMLFGLG